MTDATAPEAPAAAKADAKPKVGKKHRRRNAIQEGVGAAGKTSSKAIAAGWTDWIKRQDTSARKKKNGAIDDAGRNAMRATSKTIRKLASAPEDFWDAVDKSWDKSDRKLLWPW